MRQRGHWAWWVAPAVLATAGLWWALMDADAAPAPAPSHSGPAPAATMLLRSAAASTAATGASGAPFSVAGLQARQAQRELWQQRLERAQATLDAYRQATRYPHESQPLAEHADQAYPNQPISEEQPLRTAKGKAAEGVRLRTTQERVFVQGSESVRFTVSVQDDAGKTLPLRIVRATAHEVPAPGTASLYPELTMNFNDEGAAGDTAAGDGVFGVQLQPAAQGFGGLLGQIRVEVFLQHGQQQGFTYFDIMYTPEAPAQWQGGVREALQDGSLNFYLKAQVREPGRYVVTGRVDDAAGKPFALLSFNDEVAAGAQEFRLTLFGKLVRDAKPAFPLTLRDVDAFLLRPDAFPDRKLMPRLAGQVHVSKTHALLSFADTEWTSEERTRYLAELDRDLVEAQARVNQLGP
jgi:hypothetical protein